MKTIVITGGAGFIGSHVVRLFVNKYPEYRIINLDKLTYAGNLANLKDIEPKTSPNVTTYKGQALIVVRSGRKAGKANISVRSSAIDGIGTMTLRVE